MTAGAVAAVDLGASAGRVMVGHVGASTLRLQESHRFPNEPVALADGLHWDLDRLYAETLVGLRNAARIAPGLQSVGIDGWGVDFGLIGHDGALVGPPYCYRDPRTAIGVERVRAAVSAPALYERTGIQHLVFNTIYQLATALGTRELDAAATLLLIPDLVAYLLSGTIQAELTNASTTGFLDAERPEWAVGLLEQIGISPGLLPGIVSPGTIVGQLGRRAETGTGLRPGVRLTTVGSHDTASAVVAVPASSDTFAYISCGTWALVGVELERPVLGDDSRAANFTNERGVDGTYRYLRNVMGLWLLQESMRTWQKEGTPEDLDSLLAAAALVAPGGSVIDVDDPSFLPLGNIPARIAEQCRATDQPVPPNRAALVRCILDSLAAAFARTVEDARRLSGHPIDMVHIVGGGSQNVLLCRLTANACGLPVVAGPVEATALGNVLVQARALGLLAGDLGTLRALVRNTQATRRYEPETSGGRVAAV